MYTFVNILYSVNKELNWIDSRRCKSASLSELYYWILGSIYRVGRNEKKACTRDRGSGRLHRISCSRAKIIMTLSINVSVKSKLQHAPPGIPRAFDTFAVPGRREFDHQSLPGGGEFDPTLWGGEFELHPRFHVKSLAWRAIMGDAVLEDFRGKDCAFVANWLREKGLNKLCAVFEVFKF